MAGEEEASLLALASSSRRPTLDGAKTPKPARMRTCFCSVEAGSTCFQQHARDLVPVAVARALRRVEKDGRGTARVQPLENAHANIAAGSRLSSSGKLRTLHTGRLHTLHTAARTELQRRDGPCKLTHPPTTTDCIQAQHISWRRSPERPSVQLLQRFERLLHCCLTHLTGRLRCPLQACSCCLPCLCPCPCDVLTHPHCWTPACLLMLSLLSVWLARHSAWWADQHLSVSPWQGLSQF